MQHTPKRRRFSAWRVALIPLLLVAPGVVFWTWLFLLLPLPWFALSLWLSLIIACVFVARLHRSE